MWRTIDSCPDDGFFLVWEGGAIRTMQRDGGVWSFSALAMRRDQYGDEHVIDDAIIRDVVREPTHWIDPVDLGEPEGWRSIEAPADNPTDQGESRLSRADGDKGNNNET